MSKTLTFVIGMTSLNCSTSNPCDEGQGICHNDKDCMNDLKCNIANCDEKHYEKLHSMKKVLSPAMLRCCSKPQGNPERMKIVYILAYDNIPLSYITYVLNAMFYRY